MSLSIGIVGLPNVGKSTLFNALTKAGVVAANYPFATIEPNTGVVPIPDDRLEVLAQLFSSQRVVPATVTFVDIAGGPKGDGLKSRLRGILALGSRSRDGAARHAAGNERVGQRTQIGLRPASIDARRGSRKGGRARRSPRCSSGSSVAKPGPSVAISKRMPFGSRK